MRLSVQTPMTKKKTKKTSKDREFQIWLISRSPQQHFCLLTNQFYHPDSLHSRSATILKTRYILQKLIELL
jgi:hypothetical protein